MSSEIPGLLLAFAIYVALVAAWLRIAVKLSIAHEADRVVFATALLPVTLVAATLLLGWAGCLTRGPLVALLVALVALATWSTRGGGSPRSDAPKVPRDESTSDGPEVHFVDLDLDVLIWPDGSCVVTDEDDFATNSTRYSYPPAIEHDARAAVAALLEAVRELLAPFDQLGLSEGR